MGNATVAGTTDRIAAVMPRDQVTVLDDWGGGAMLGMSAERVQQRPGRRGVRAGRAPHRAG